MLPRLHVPSTFFEGQVLALPPEAARHLQVLRLQPGEPVLLFNGSDGAEWPAEVLAMGKRSVDVRLGAPVNVERELPWHVTLALGVPANDRMDGFVEKACELGAMAIQPLLCERSVLRLSGDRAEARQRHWQGVASAASEQCGRVRVAEVAPMRSLASWLAGAQAEPAPCKLVLSFAAGSATPGQALMSAGRHGAAAEAPRILVLSGPEGGLAEAEEAAAVASGFTRVGLGARVLRADTAPLALLAWIGLQGRAEGSPQPA